MPKPPIEEDIATIEADPRWTAFLARDATADGRFVVAVLTTGIYCRPTCPARRPKPGNARLYACNAEAERAGFRACRRCRPDGPSRAAEHGALVAQACHSLTEADEAPDLARLAQAAGLSPFHFHRVFKAGTGVTPRAYAAAERQRRLRVAMADPATNTTDAIFSAGYGSSGRFYAASDDVLGMTPAAYRRGGADVEIRSTVAPCWLGLVLVAATARGLCAILLGDEADALNADLRRRFPKARFVDPDPGFAATVETVVRLVERPQLGLALPLDIAGTAFQRRVWEALRRIPAGATVSYRAVAEEIGQPKAMRAVAGACAANALAVAVPCHRVVHGSGGASGYRWGVDRKRRLLAREAEADARGRSGEAGAEAGVTP